jgi:type I restriction enzyme S subunit
MDALPSEGLPAGWAVAPLSDLVQPPEPINPAAAFEGRAAFAYVSLTSVEPGKIVAPEMIAPASAPGRARQRIRAGDTLFSCVRVYLEKVVRVPEPLDGEVCSTAFAVLRPRPGIDPGYLYWLTRRPAFLRAAEERQKGNSPPAIQEADLRAIEVPVAPPAEQTRIVAAVNALFEEVEAGEAALARAREGLTQFRASLLHAACTGALTADWRAANPTNETADDLLAQIMEARGDSIGRRGRSLLPPDLSNEPTLPFGWRWASVDQVTNFLGNGLARAPDGDATDLRILRISAVRPLKVDQAEHRFYRPLPGENVAGATTQRHDLLFTRYSGSEHYVGVCGLVRFAEPMLFPDKVMCARPLPGFTDLAEYLEIALNAGPSRAYIARNIRTTAGQKGIAGSSIRACPVPVPPRSELAAIIAAVREALAEATALPTDAFAAQLRQSILHAAFTGRLVPQDPADEPAAALLARLRATPAASRRPRARRTATQPDLIETNP